MADLRKILLVDDEKELLLPLASFLILRDFEVITAENGKEAFDILQERKKSLGAHGIYAVVTDWMMPKMTGLELLNKIRSAGAFSALPVVLMSGVVTKEELEPVLYNGADSVLLKPFSNQSLVDKIDEAVVRRKTREAEKLFKE